MVASSLQRKNYILLTMLLAFEITALIYCSLQFSFNTIIGNKYNQIVFVKSEYSAYDEELTNFFNKKKYKLPVIHIDPSSTGFNETQHFQFTCYDKSHKELFRLFYNGLEHVRITYPNEFSFVFEIDFDS